MTKVTKPKKKSAKDQKKLIGMAMGGVLLGLLILAGIVMSLKTNDGTLIVEVNQPDAMPPCDITTTPTASFFCITRLKRM